MRHYTSYKNVVKMPLRYNLYKNLSIYTHDDRNDSGAPSSIYCKSAVYSKAFNVNAPDRDAMN